MLSETHTALLCLLLIPQIPKSSAVESGVLFQDWAIFEGLSTFQVAEEDTDKSKNI